MAQFEQEIRTSLTQIQTQLAAVQQQADRSNASIARMGPTARTAAAGVGEIERNVGKIGAAASKTGGPIAGMVASLGGLAAFNPIALAAGAAIGVITSAVYGLINALQSANEEQGKFAAAMGAAPGLAAAKSREALLNADPNELRYGVDTKTMEHNLASFKKTYSKANLSEQQALQVSLGMENMDPGAFSQWVRERQYAPGGIQANAAEAEQLRNAGRVAFEKEQAVGYGSGTLTKDASKRFLIETSPDLKAQFAAMSADIRSATEAKSGWQFLGSEARAEANIRELQAKYAAAYDQVGVTSK